MSLYFDTDVLFVCPQLL